MEGVERRPIQNKGRMRGRRKRRGENKEKEVEERRGGERITHVKA